MYMKAPSSVEGSCSAAIGFSAIAGCAGALAIAGTGGPVDGREAIGVAVRCGLQ